MLQEHLHQYYLSKIKEGGRQGGRKERDARKERERNFQISNNKINDGHTSNLLEDSH